MATVGDRYEPNGARERRASPLNGDQNSDPLPLGTLASSKTNLDTQYSQWSVWRAQLSCSE